MLLATSIRRAVARRYTPRALPGPEEKQQPCYAISSFHDLARKNVIPAS